MRCADLDADGKIRVPLVAAPEIGPTPFLRLLDLRGFCVNFHRYSDFLQVLRRDNPAEYRRKVGGR